MLNRIRVSGYKSLRDLESWRFFYFEPRERMRAATAIKEARHVGPMGEELAAFLVILKTRQPRQFQALEKALRLLFRMWTASKRT